MSTCLKCYQSLGCHPTGFIYSDFGKESFKPLSRKAQGWPSKCQQLKPLSPPVEWSSVTWVPEGTLGDLESLPLAPSSCRTLGWALRTWFRWGEDPAAESRIQSHGRCGVGTWDSSSAGLVRCCHSRHFSAQAPDVPRQFPCFLSTRFSLRKATIGGWPASASLRGKGQELFTCKNSIAGSYHMQFPAASPSCHSCQPLGVLAATGSPSVALVLVCGLEAGVFMKFEIVLSELM